MNTLNPLLIAKRLFFVSISCLYSSISAQTVHFDFDTGESNVEFFSGVTSNLTVDLSQYGRVQVADAVWLEISPLLGASAASGHVNNAGIGVAVGNGGNQLGNNESLTFAFYDALTGGNAVTVDLLNLEFGNFEGGDDGAIVSTGDLSDITLSADVNSSGTGYNYVSNTHILSFAEDAVTVSSFTVSDNSSTSGAGSRINSLTFSVPAQSVIRNEDAPNIIYIIVDDMGYSDLGSFGGEIDTPNLDRLADEGLRFRQHYTYAKCETSRTSLLTGMYYEKSGLKIRRTVGAKTVAEILKAADYRTAITGKWHMENPNDGMGEQHPLDRGFDYFYGILGGSSHFYDPGNVIRENRTLYLNSELPSDFYATDYFAQKGIGFIQTVHAENTADADITNDKPFFLYLAFTAPHEPLQAPSALIAKYRNRMYQASPSVDKSWDDFREERYQRQLDLGIVDSSWPLSPKPDHLPEWDDLTDAQKDLEDFRQAVYAAMIEQVDYQVGQLLDELDTLGLRNDTLIYFVSDNGGSAYGAVNQQQDSSIQADENGRTAGKRLRVSSAGAWMSNTPFRFYKQNQHNGGVLTPMIVSWPGAIDPSRDGDIEDIAVHLYDFAPTAADLAGVTMSNAFPAAPTHDGISFASYFRESAVPERVGGIGFNYQASDFAYLDYPWKIASYRRRPWELYNMETDRTEVNDLAFRMPAKVAELSTAFQNWIASRDIDNPSPSSIFDGMETDTSTYSDMVNFYDSITGSGAVVSQTDPQFEVTSIGSVASLTIDTDQTNNGRWTTTMDAGQIGGSSDEFVFAYKSVGGDGYSSCKVVGLQSGGSHRRAGVMYRANVDADAPFVFLEVNNNGGSPVVQFRSRSSAGANATLSTSSASVSLPVFLRLDRKLNDFTGYYSMDGRNWSELGTVNVDLPASTLVGTAVCPQTNGSTGTVIFAAPKVYSYADYPTVDSDLNGKADLLEYAAGYQEMSVSVSLDSDVSVQFDRMQDASFLNYSVQSSDDLNTWEPDATMTQSSAVSGDAGMETVTFSGELPAATKRFYRIEIN